MVVNEMRFGVFGSLSAEDANEDIEQDGAQDATKDHGGQGDVDFEIFAFKT